MDDFAVFILTHGRPDKIHTLKTLQSYGYTGKVYLVIDNEDKTAPQYFEKYGSHMVLQFDKQAVARACDEGDNFNDRRSIFYARNVCSELAQSVGVRYFVQLDDDYTYFSYRFDGQGFYAQKMCHKMDDVFALFVDYLKRTPFASVAMGQGGDYIAGAGSCKSIGTKRKAMNTFVCDTERPFRFVGKINEDVNTYTCEQRRGLPMLTILGVSVYQEMTQRNEGGMSQLYLDAGTYIKSFYSVMYAPSCVKVSTLAGYKNGVSHRRIHHRVNWNATAPQIIRATHRKAGAKLQPDPEV